MLKKRPRKRMRETILDEQEQEEIVAALAYQNQTSSKSFRLVITALCLVPIIVAAHLMNRHNLFISLLTISSLAMTAFTLYCLPADTAEHIDGPLARFLPFLNGVLAFLITCIAWVNVTGERSERYSVFTSIHILPLVMCTLATFIRHSIATTSRSIRDLEKKKYTLKGA